MNPIKFPQLCVLATLVLQENPEAWTSYPEWKEATKDKAVRMGYPRPDSIDVNKALAAVESSERRKGRIRPRATLTTTDATPPTPALVDPTVLPRAPRPTAFAQPGSTPSSTCGASMPVCGAKPLTCNLDPDHDGAHGVRFGEHVPAFVTWPREAVPA